MKNSAVLLADLDEMVFEQRNHGYGAYMLRKNYNRSLGRALIVGMSLFLLLTVGPWVWQNFLAASGMETDLNKKVVLEMTDIVLPPVEDEVTPEMPPDVPPPVISAIAFNVPVPVPDDQVPIDVSINEMDSIKEVDNIDVVDVDGDVDGYNFDEIDGDGLVNVVIEEPEEDPDPNAWIMVEKEPGPVNMDNIKKLIGYPPAAKEAEIEGKVILRILVGTTGKYERHLVVRNPHPLLTKAVEAQISNLEFTPGIQAGEPVKVWVTIPFDFHLLR
ncbi:MAG: energy transducer TonB [Bacteroidia bacterium]|nr:energy transducer TonB [Bacteroidia bacterium]